MMIVALVRSAAAALLILAPTPVVSQIDLRPPMRPTSPPVKVEKPTIPSPAPAKPVATRRELLTPEELERRIRALILDAKACVAAAEPVRAIEVAEIDLNGLCQPDYVQRFRTQSARAATLLKECGELGEFQRLRLDFDQTLADLERQRSTVVNSTALQVYNRRISALKGSTTFPYLVEAQSQLEEALAALREKVAAENEIMLACGVTTGPVRPAPASPIEVLARAAKKEGRLAVMALPRDWCGYGGLIESFRTQYGIAVEETNPNANSEDQIAALKAGAAGKPAPDVVEVSHFHGGEARKAGLLMPYKVSVWDTIPNAAKDPDGYWAGDYFDTVVFAVNADAVRRIPVDWPDLLKSDYRQAVALAGHPHRTNEAILGVLAAGTAATGGDVMLAGEAGLRFFGELLRAGTLSAKSGSALTLADSTTPVVIRLESAARKDAAKLAGKTKVSIVVPRTGVLASTYVQAISARARHPNAARLWLEHLYSDRGQLAFLKAGCRPIRHRDLFERGVVPAELKALVPGPAAYDRVMFPDPAGLRAAGVTVFNLWGRTVGLDIR